MFYPLKVKEVRKETAQAVSLKFEVPDELKEVFSYKHGQFLTLKVEVEGKQYRRAYSLCTSPVTDTDPVVTSKRVSGGIVSNYLNENVRVGDVIEVFPPTGKFTIDLDPEHGRSYVLFGGGSGITPLLSIMRTILHVEPKSTVHLFYGNYNEENIIFKTDIEDLQAHHGDRLKVDHILSDPSESWKGKKGIMDKSTVFGLLEEAGITKDDGSEIFICGPSGMLDQVTKALKEKEFPDKKTHVEYFTAKLPDTDNIDTYVKEDVTGEEIPEDFKEADVTILLDGEEYNIKVKPEEKILERAMEEDIDPPYACQMGICTTCKAFLHEGKVEMEENEGLTDQEIEEGYILTCQSHPRTSKIKLEYE